MDPQAQPVEQQQVPAPPPTEGAAPPPFDWSSVPEDAFAAIPDDVLARLPEDRVLTLPKVKSKIDKDTYARAQGMTKVQMDQFIAQQNAKAAEAAEAQRNQQKLALAETDPLKLAEVVKQEVQESEQARQARAMSAQQFAEWSQRNAQAAQMELNRTAQLATQAIQAQIEAFGLDASGRDEVWRYVEDESARGVLTSPAAVNAVTARAVALAGKLHADREVQSRAKIVGQQAERSARAEVGAALPVDPARGGGPSRTPEAQALERALASDDPKDLERAMALARQGKFSHAGFRVA